ncbi:MAG: hypothetical protein AAFO83_01600 [Cyanobacteria bacterium J06607_13]
MAAALAFAGVFNMMSAVLAEGTAAGTPIENTATATYSDGTTTFDAISNTVVINVAEVAGITVASSDFQDPNGGSIVTDDVVTFDFEITNTGNAPTFFFIPGLNNITATEGTILRVDVVDEAVLTTQAEAINPAPQPTASFGEVPAAGATTDTIAGLPNGGLVQPDQSITVRVTVEVDADAVGERVGVQFGNTDDNAVAPADDSQNQQNIPDLSEAPAGTANADDVRTFNEGAETPVNGEREAAAFRDEAFSTAPIDLAQALILKSSTASDPNSTPADPSDHSIEYSLELQVGNQTFPGVDAGDLEGTDISLDTGSGATTVNRILVSDAIPENTTFDPATPPVAPTDWTVVYSTDAIAPGANPLQATWVTTQPAAAAITRIGFIYDSDTDGVLTPGTSVPGFSFTVVTDGLTAPGGNIANIAQVFGETAGDPGDNIVYDESGDQQPNNFDDGTTPTNNTSTFDPVNDLGVADENDPDPASTDNDPNTNNTGIGPDGESTVDTINSVPPAVGDIFNGPDNTPDATGPNNTDDDFTNVSTTVDTVGEPGSPSNPDAITITNELLNPATAPTNLDTVTLLPLAPTEADTATGTTGNYGLDGDIPDGTLVTITFGTQVVEYEYTSGNPAGPFHTPGDNTTVPAPVVVGTLQPGLPVEYEVEIDLPAGTDQVEGYGIPIVAFVDNDGSGTFTPASETVSNITIDRVYTGFMELVKEARVVYAERDGVTLAPSAFSSDLATLNGFDIRPGDELEYRITYTNISEAAPVSGGGNATLDALNFTITEDGNAAVGAGTNNWASTTLHKNGTVATGTVEYFDGATSLGTTDPADETTGPSAVTVYENSVGTVAPQVSDELRFTREVL